ncbi:NHL repeat containing protein [Calothrix sp. 336/3]|uniref:NHL repeat containing protein n=1 Tax=Calothrix sp. 336/3 TaxID=1337936 RepID=UPI0004E3F359|nr:NHL repeat containing protein [Calothrix sp. 336/3]AKG23771.1 NHL repeat containing protein [Calothrix sp. 336/3]
MTNYIQDETSKKHLFDNQPIIIGQDFSPDKLPIPSLPSAHEIFAPRGACLFAHTGYLWVSDTGNHRLLGWEKIPKTDNQAANWVIGQPDFYHEGQNGKNLVNSHTVSVPTGICECAKGMAVADAWNHRVLIWQEVPGDTNVPADIVLGQADFTSNLPNRGKGEATANTLNWCYGVYYFQGKLFVADTGNRRVLIWHELPRENGQPADLVLGQSDMISRDENGGNSPNSRSMRWCHDITFWGENLVVTDAGNNRVMIWQGMPTENNQPCTVVLGQRDFHAVEMNQNNYFPNSSSLSMPYGVESYQNYLLVADTANSRILGWEKSDNLLDLWNRNADILLGQTTFTSKSENRDFGRPKRDSFNWCYGIQVCHDTAIIADSGNNRILLWKLNHGG